MTTPDKMLVVKEAEWLSDGMMPVSIKILTCDTQREPYEPLEQQPVQGCSVAGKRFCVWHGAAGTVGSCCGGVSDFAVLEDAVSMIETRFPGAKWLMVPGRRTVAGEEALGARQPCSALPERRELDRRPA